MNLREASAEVYTRLNEEAGAPRFFLQEDVTRALNHGLQEMADACEFFESFANIPLMSGKLYYDLRTCTNPGVTVLSVGRAYDTRNNRWLEPSSAEDLDRLTRGRWENVITQASHYFLRGLWWLGVFPLRGGDSRDIVRVTFTSIPPKLTQLSQQFPLPEEFCEGPLEYALYELNVQDHETLLALEHYQKFEVEQARLAKDIADRIQIPRTWQVRPQLPGFDRGTIGDWSE